MTFKNSIHQEVHRTIFQIPQDIHQTLKINTNVYLIRPIFKDCNCIIDLHWKSKRLETLPRRIIALFEQKVVAVILADESN